MRFDPRRTRTFVAATGGVALAALLAASPARADGDMWNSMLGWVGMGHKDAAAAGPDDGAIDYTPKPALVVPPKMDLPPPQASTSTPADWPHDPDATERVKAEADSRRPAPSSDSSGDNNNSGDFVADADKAKPDNGESEACSDAAGKPICFYGPSSLMNFTKGWGNWGGMFQSHPEDTSKLRIGQEPPRQYLIQPPPGYQMPKVKDEDADATDADTSKYDNVDVGAPRHHHHHSSDNSSASN